MKINKIKKKNLDRYRENVRNHGDVSYLVILARLNAMAEVCHSHERAGYTYVKCGTFSFRYNSEGLVTLIKWRLGGQKEVDSTHLKNEYYKLGLNWFGTEFRSKHHRMKFKDMIEEV